VPGGRPTIFTREVLDKLEQAFSMDCTDSEAALYANITLSALTKHGERHPEFVERKRALKNKPFLIARNTLLQGIKSDPDLALKYLERKKKDEFSLRSELTGPGGESLTCTLIDYRGKPNDPSTGETD
jgi:hypothetical protein